MTQDNDKPTSSRKVSNNQNQLYLMLGTMQSDIKNILNMLGKYALSHEKLSADVEDRLNAHSLRIATLEKEAREELREAKDHLSTRINELEKWRWKIAGIATLAPTILVVVGWFITQ